MRRRARRTPSGAPANPGPSRPLYPGAQPGVYPGFEHPTGPGPARPPRRIARRLRWVGLLTVIVLAPLLVVAIVAQVGICTPRQGELTGAYALQPGRTAEWVANGTQGYSSAQLESLASDNDIVLIPKFADGADLQKQFEDVRQIVANGKKEGRDVKVYLYFNATFWLDKNVQGWVPYSSSFQSSYLLKDSKGDPVPYYGIGSTQSDGEDELGHVLDLANPAYREWAVRTVQEWMQQAPAAGVVLDSANPFVGSTAIRGALASGTGTPNDLLCGADAAVDSAGNCDRVTEWNDGLSDLLDSIKTAFAPTGHTVLYNGVAPSALRPNRNIGLLDDASGATNESFCFSTSLDGNKVTPTDLTSDLEMMGKAATEGKTLIEIVNYQKAENLKYGSYCLGSFLMGWEPGSTYLNFHQNYRMLNDQPAFPEMNLDLGAPTGAYTDDGGVLLRSFANGVVAVNPTSSPVTFTVPHDGVQVADGKVEAPFTAGETSTLAARSSFFLLSGDAGLRTDTGGAQLCRTVS